MININRPLPGLVGYGNAKTGISATAQHMVVGTGTHTFVIDYPTGSKRDISQVYESDRRVGNDTWENYLNMKKYDMRLYLIIGVTDEEIAYALDYIKRKYLGKSYGYLQWLWFPYKMFCQKILGINVNKQTNWFKNWLVSGIVCHEITWWYLYKITECNPVKWSKLRKLLDEYRPETITSTDAIHLLEQNTDIFKLELNREDEITTLTT